MRTEQEIKDKIKSTNEIANDLFRDYLKCNSESLARLRLEQSNRYSEYVLALEWVLK